MPAVPPSPTVSSIPWSHDLLHILSFYLNLKIILFPSMVPLGLECAVAFLDICVYTYVYMPVYVSSGAPAPPCVQGSLLVRPSKAWANY